MLLTVDELIAELEQHRGKQICVVDANHHQYWIKGIKISFDSKLVGIKSSADHVSDRPA